MTKRAEHRRSRGPLNALARRRRHMIASEMDKRHNIILWADFRSETRRLPRAGCGATTRYGGNAALPAKYELEVP